MIQYREIIRQLGLGLSQSQIAASCGCARKTVRNITVVLKERGLSFASFEAASDAELEALLFPGKHSQPSNAGCRTLRKSPRNLPGMASP